MFIKYPSVFFLFPIISLSIATNLLAGPTSLTVTGHATIKTPPTEVLLNVSVVTQESNAEEALKENNSKLNAVIFSLTKLGLSEKNWHTGNFQINPIYTGRPQNPPANWIPSIQGYRVTNSLTIRTKQLELIGKLIDTSLSSGANSVDSISFTLSNPQEKRQEAISLAAQNAMQDAKTLAETAMVKLSKILTITTEREEPEPLYPKMRLASAPSIQSDTPILAGDVEVSAHVKIVYQIDPQ